MTDPKTKRFNAVLETLDGLTLFKYDRVTDSRALLFLFVVDLPNGSDNTLIREYISAARALDYGFFGVVLPDEKIPKSP